MNRPGHVDVTTEVGYCNFCQRSRNLRREEHHLGQLVRTIVSCETCHRTLASTMGVAQAPEPAKEEAPAVQPQAAVEEKPKPARRATAKRPAAKRATVKRTSAAKAKTPPKPRSTATRQTSKKK